MRALNALVYLSLLWSSPAQSYNTKRSSLEKPAKDNVCSYLENPNLVHLVQTRIQSAHLPGHVLVQEVPTTASRNAFFLVDPQQENVMRNINFGYLNMNQPISSMGDLIEMESDEIGSHYIPKEKPKEVVPWKMDDVKSLLASPKVLPDVMIVPEEEEVPPPMHLHHHYLDEQDARLGRFVVNDAPASIPDIIRTEDSELTRETQDISHSEIGEKYLSDPARYKAQIPTLVIDKVVPREEIPEPPQPNFMEELYKIKLALALAEKEVEALDRKEALEHATSTPESQEESSLQHIPSQVEVMEQIENEAIKNSLNADHSTNAIDKDSKVENNEEETPVGKSNTLDTENKDVEDEVTTHRQVAESTSGTPLKVTVSQREEEDDSKHHSGLKKLKQSQKDKDISKDDTETPGGEEDDIKPKSVESDEIKNKKKSSKHSKKLSRKEGETSGRDEHENKKEKTKKRKTSKSDKIPGSSETSIEKPSAMLEDLEEKQVPKNVTISSRISKNPRDTLLDGLLSVI